MSVFIILDKVSILSCMLAITLHFKSFNYIPAGLSFSGLVLRGGSFAEHRASATMDSLKRNIICILYCFGFFMLTAKQTLTLPPEMLWRKRTQNK